MTQNTFIRGQGVVSGFCMTGDTISNNIVVVNLIYRFPVCRELSVTHLALIDYSDVTSGFARGSVVIMTADTTIDKISVVRCARDITEPTVGAVTNITFFSGNNVIRRLAMAAGTHTVNLGVVNHANRSP